MFSSLWGGHFVTFAAFSFPVQLDTIQPDKALEEAKRLIDAGGMT